jgi:transketolase
MTKQLEKHIRLLSLQMIYQANASHIGSCLSMADLLAILYGKILRVDSNNPDWPDRDRFILSKGHGAAILYAVLAEKGFFPKEWLETYCQDGSQLTGHVSHYLPGIEASTGSLGHGLPIGCGIALAGKREDKSYRVFVMLSDGELDEGSNWESILFATQHQIDNKVVDYNKIQSFGTVQDVLELEPLLDKFQAFRWSVREIDGHDFQQIEEAFSSIPFETAKPSCIIAHTVKGKGVSFMENQLAWHYKSPNKEQLAEAITEIEGLS